MKLLSTSKHVSESSRQAEVVGPRAVLWAVAAEPVVRNGGPGIACQLERVPRGRWRSVPEGEAFASRRQTRCASPCLRFLALGLLLPALRTAVYCFSSELRRSVI